MATNWNRVRCALTFVTANIVPRNRNIWRPTTTRVLKVATLDALEDQIRDVVVSRLRQAHTLRKNIRRRRQLLHYETEIMIDFCGQSSYKPMTDDNHAFEKVQDLFEDPAGNNLFVDITVTLFIGRRRRREDQPRFSYEGKKMPDAADLVLERNSYDTDRWKYTYFRLGSVSPAVTRRPPFYDPQRYIPGSNDKLCEDRHIDSWLTTRRGIRVRDIIYGYSWLNHPLHPESFHLIKVRCWDFGNFLIGDTIGAFAEYTFDQRDHFRAMYGACQSKDDLYQAVLNHGQAAQTRSPFLPSFTLNRFDADALGLDVVLASGEHRNAHGRKAEAVVRFVNHLDVDYDGENDRAWLPYNSQWSFKAKHDEAFIQEKIAKELEHHAGNPELGPDESATARSLFIGPLAGTWEIELWVLPQATAQSRRECMYRFPGPGTSSSLGLSQFLSYQRVQNKGTASRGLYMEAHIVRKSQEEIDDMSDVDENIEEGPEINEDEQQDWDGDLIQSSDASEPEKGDTDIESDGAEDEGDYDDADVAGAEAGELGEDDREEEGRQATPNQRRQPTVQRSSSDKRQRNRAVLDAMTKYPLSTYARRTDRNGAGNLSGGCSSKNLSRLVPALPINRTDGAREGKTSVTGMTGATDKTSGAMAKKGLR